MGTIPLIDLKRQYKGLAARIRRAAIRVLDSGVFILGPEGRRFESEFARVIGSKHAIGVASGTAALKLGLESFGVGPGDEVIVPAFTFIATATAVSALGARPVFVDVETANLTLDPEETAAAITRRTKAIIPVHIYGAPAAMGAILAAARHRKIKVLEDCAQAHMTVCRGRMAGTLGAAAAYSFYPSKNLGAAGDAGLILTGSSGLAETCRQLRNVGRPSKSSSRHQRIGTNSRLDEIQAAVLRVKLPRLKAWTAARRRVASWYASGLRGLPLRLPDPGSAGSRHCFHLYVIRLRQRDQLKKHLADAGIATGIYFPRPLHLEEAYRSRKLPAGSFPVSEQACRTVLALPMFPELTKREVEKVCRAVWNFFS